jgi:hypothetical protein
VENAAYPPHYVKLPVDVACAAVDDGLIVTMARILGLCWDDNYRASPPHRIGRLAQLVDRSRSTLYRHLDRLQALGWLHVERAGRDLVLRPLFDIPGGPSERRPSQGARRGRARASAGPDDGGGELGQALREAGILGRAFRELVALDIDPCLVRAWHWWSHAPDQKWLENAPGYIISRLRAGDRPPDEYMQIGRLTAGQTATIHAAWVRGEQVTDWPSLDDERQLQRLAPLWATIYDGMMGYRL